MQSVKLILLSAITFWSLPVFASEPTTPRKKQFELAKFKAVRDNGAEILKTERSLNINHQSEHLLCQADASVTTRSNSAPEIRRIRRIPRPQNPCQPSPAPAVERNSRNPYFAPRKADDKRLNPLTTTIPLNNTFISHRTNWEVFGKPVFGDNIRQDIGFGGILKLSSQVIEDHSPENIYTTDQTGYHFQLNGVRERREITTSKLAVEKLLGLETKMSLIGSCLFGDGEPTEECTYTPGIVVDRDSIDPATLAPTRVFHTSNVGEVVTPESRAAIEQSGFQRGANGQEIGVDLYFPNVGTISREEGTSRTRRQEKINLMPLSSFSRVRQVVRANHKRSVIGRTVKGTPLVFGGDKPNGMASLRSLLAHSAAALSFVLPDAIPKIEASKDRFNPKVNQNLFIAANNTRLPADSYTIYHIGFGSADSITAKVKHPKQIPLGSFHGVWVGLSPVVERKYESASLYEPHGNISIIADAGGEGGADSDVQLVSIVNEDNFSSDTLQNIHSQIYIKFFSQDADVYTESSTIEKTKYQPHFSFTGNITGSRNIFRYYTGGIINNPFRAYLGLDYKYQTFNGWSFSTGSIGYLNPDREYYSQLWGNINKQIKFNRRTKLAFFTGFNYAIDRPNKIREVILSSRSSSVTLGSQLQWQRLSLSANYNFDNLLPNSIESRLILNLGIGISDRLSFSGYYTPINRNISRSRYGANVSWRLGKEYNNPSLSLGWSNLEYRFENGFTQSDNIFTMQLKVGQPSNSLSPGISQELQTEETEDFERQQQERIRE